MTKILLVGHGNFAASLLETARMLVGTAGDVRPVEFPVGADLEALTARLGDELDGLGLAEGERALVLTDVAGGSPSRAALVASMGGRAAVVAGTNLPMLLDAMFAPDGLSAGEVADKVVASGQAGIRYLTQELTGQGEGA